MQTSVKIHCLSDFSYSKSGSCKENSKKHFKSKCLCQKSVSHKPWRKNDMDRMEYIYLLDLAIIFIIFCLLYFKIQEFVSLQFGLLNTFWIFHIKLNSWYSEFKWNRATSKDCCYTDCQVRKMSVVVGCVFFFVVVVFKIVVVIVQGEGKNKSPKKCM